MIQGEFIYDGFPTLTATVSIPETNTHGSVDFLVDTGATTTLIHPNDAERLAIDFGKLKNEDNSFGVGGRSKVFQEKAELIFHDEDGQTTQSYQLEISIAEPSEHNNNFPSLLGRDILNRMTMVYDPRNNTLNFTS